MGVFSSVPLWTSRGIWGSFFLSPYLHSLPSSFPDRSTTYVSSAGTWLAPVPERVIIKNGRKNINLSLNIQRSLELSPLKTVISCHSWRNCSHLCSFHITTFPLHSHYVKSVNKIQFLPCGFQTFSFSTESEHLPCTHTFLISWVALAYSSPWGLGGWEIMHLFSFQQP